VEIYTGALTPPTRQKECESAKKRECQPQKGSWHSRSRSEANIYHCLMIKMGARVPECHIYIPPRLRRANIM